MYLEKSREDGGLKQILLITEFMNFNWSLKKLTLEEGMWSRSNFLQGLWERKFFLWGKREFLSWQEKVKGQDSREVGE